MPDRTGYVESLGEIIQRTDSGDPPPRPTEYKGVQFRSHLEARFAFYLDSIGEEWLYEPRVYVGDGRGYLPDFEIVSADRPTFIELKPTMAEVPDAQVKMAVIWQTHPDALLIVASEERRAFSWCYLGGEWAEWNIRWST